MKIPRPLSPRLLWGLLLITAFACPSFAQAPATPPLTFPPSLISLAEARVIIDGAVAFARDQNMRMAVVVVDQSGSVVSADRVDRVSFANSHLAEGKAFASAAFRQTTAALADLAQTTGTSVS